MTDGQAKSLNSTISPNVVGLKGRWYFNHIFFILTLAIFCFLFLWHLESPGLNYDELLWTNPILPNGDGQTFITYSFQGIPIMLMPYIGALKTYLFLPVSKIFGFTVSSIRGFALIEAISILILVYVFTLRNISKRVAIVAVGLLAINTTFLYQTKTDYGPVNLMFILQMFLLFFIINFTKTQKSSSLVGIVAVSLLGFFDKFNFLWIIFSSIMASLLIYRQEVKNLIATHKKNVWLIFVIFISTGIVGYKLIRFLFTFFNIPDRALLFEKLQLLTTTINNDDFYFMVFHRVYSFPKILFYFYVSVIIIGLTLALIKKIKINKIAIFLLIMTFFTILQILLTKNATGAHHLMTIFPAFYITVAYFMWTIIDSCKVNFYLRGAVIIIFTSALVLQFLILLNFEKTLMRGESQNPAWSQKIYALSNDIIKEEEQSDIYFLDWGIYTQALTLTGSKRLKDFTWIFNAPVRDEKTMAEIYKTYFASKNALVIMHPPEKTIFHASRINFFKFIASKNIKLEKLKPNYDPRSSTYEIYRITPQI